MATSLSMASYVTMSRDLSLSRALLTSEEGIEGKTSVLSWAPSLWDRTLRTWAVMSDAMVEAYGMDCL